MPPTEELRVALEPDGHVRSLTVEPGANLRVVVVPAAVTVSRGGAMLCQTDSPTLTPVSPGQTPFATLAGALVQVASQGGRLVVLGHASATGSQTRNDALADARASTVAAWLRRDEATWVEVLAEHGSPADVQRWLQHWAQTLRWNIDPGRTDGVLDSDTQRAVVAFQQECATRFAPSLAADGKITRATLAAVFAVSLLEMDTHFREAGLEVDAPVSLAEDDVLGCGTLFATDPRLIHEFGDSPATQQRVDVVAVPPPCKWTAQHGAAALMLFTRQDPIDPVGPSPRAGRLTIQLRDIHGRPVAAAAYTLDVGGATRSGSTDAQGRLVEDDVGRARLQLSLLGSPTLVFDHPYIQSLRESVFDVASLIDDDDGLAPFPEDPLPALIEDDGEQDETALVFDDDDDDPVPTDVP